MNQKYFLTTAIPYINADPHLGHVQEFLLTNTLSNYLKRQNQIVKWQNGTDDNSLKNVLAAESQNIPLQDFLALRTDAFKNLLQSLNLNPDYLVHTSSPNHHRVVKEFIQKLNPQDLYLNSYHGLYCVGCEDFLKDHELVNGLCPDHKTKPETVSEENIFFKLSNYQEKIKELILTKELTILPRSKEKEILQFLNQGLKDISISRPDHSPLGVDFPGHPGQKVYVWIDALVNYLTGVNYFSPEGERIWKESQTIQVIGKNVWKFHALYWIGLLLSANIPLPKTLVIHGFITKEGQKISKSLNNGVDLNQLLSKYSGEELGLYLLGKLNWAEDSDFKEQELFTFYHQELVHQIGNLFPRVLSLSQKFNYPLKRKIQPVTGVFFDLQELYDKTLKLSQELNKSINDSKIWTLQNVNNSDFFPKWEESLNLISDNLSVFFPSKEDKINNSFIHKTILFPKKEF